jgi:hypothetical protein
MPQRVPLAPELLAVSNPSTEIPAAAEEEIRRSRLASIQHLLKKQE